MLSVIIIDIIMSLPHIGRYKEVMKKQALLCLALKTFLKDRSIYQ